MTRRKYERYLASPMWRSKRAKVIERDENKCTVCGATEKLEVHHRWYPRVLGEEELYELVTYCAACHDIAHWKFG